MAMSDFLQVLLGGVKGGADAAGDQLKLQQKAAATEQQKAKALQGDIQKSVILETVKDYAKDGTLPNLPQPLQGETEQDYLGRTLKTVLGNMKSNGPARRPVRAPIFDGPAKKLSF